MIPAPALASSTALRLARPHARPARRLDKPAAHHELVDEPVRAVEVEDEVELADVAKVEVERLDEEVDRFQGDELVVATVDSRHEIEGGVASVDDFCRGAGAVRSRVSASPRARRQGPQQRRRRRVAPLEDVAGPPAQRPPQHGGAEVAGEARALPRRGGDVPLAEADLALAREEEDEAKLEKCFRVFFF